MAFDPDVFSATMIPATGNPAGVRVRRLNIGARDPHILPSIPTMIASVPSPVAMLGRWWRDNFTVRRGRTNGDVNLSVGDAGGQEKCTGCGEKLLLHASFSFEVLPFRTQFYGEKLCRRRRICARGDRRRLNLKVRASR